jgi:hypothetical protein
MVITLRALFIPAILTLTAAPALARDPQPKPSGIVIHLFGQNSIMSNVLPTGPTPTTAAPAPGQPAAPPGASASASSAPQPAYVEPTAGEILHQMFITGDGTQAKPASGRVADRPGN